MADQHYDFLIIGGGQAGIPLAHALAGEGKRVALAERKYLGGSCVNFGCTPTKAAIASAKLAFDARRAEEFGLRIPNVEVDFPAVIRRANDVAIEFRHSLEKGIVGENPKLLQGHARLAGKAGDRFRVTIGDRTITASQVILNTGTRTLMPDVPGLESIQYLDSGNWLQDSVLPQRLAVIGGGYIGIEMAQFYRRMGSEVSVIEPSAEILGHEDAVIASALRGFLAAEGIEFRLETKLKEVAHTRHGVVITTAQNGADSESVYSKIFLATGRRPNTDELGLDTVGVQVNEHEVVSVDERLATNIPGIWAAGDIRGGPQFTHTSWDDYRILKSQLLGDHSRTTKRIVPYAVFADPELGRVGMTERQAAESGQPLKIAQYEMKRNGKAREIGESKGFIRVITNAETEKILGAAVLSAHASELVHLYVDMMNADAPYTVIRDAVHIHPTLAEAVQSALAKIK